MPLQTGKVKTPRGPRPASARGCAAFGPARAGKVAKRRSDARGSRSAFVCHARARAGFRDAVALGNVVRRRVRLRPRGGDVAQQTLVSAGEGLWLRLGGCASGARGEAAVPHKRSEFTVCGHAPARGRDRGAVAAREVVAAARRASPGLAVPLVAQHAAPDLAAVRRAQSAARHVLRVRAAVQRVRSVAPRAIPGHAVARRARTEPPHAAPGLAAVQRARLVVQHAIPDLAVARRVRTEPHAAPGLAAAPFVPPAQQHKRRARAALRNVPPAAPDASPASPAAEPASHEALSRAPLLPGWAELPAGPPASQSRTTPAALGPERDTWLPMDVRVRA